MDIPSRQSDIGRGGSRTAQRSDDAATTEMENTGWQAESAVQAERDSLPIGLLVGAALGALVALIIAIMRRAPVRRTEPSRLDAVVGEGHLDAQAARPGAPATVPADRVATAASRQEATTATQTGVPPSKAASGQPTRPTGWPTTTKYVVGVILFLAMLALLYFVRSVIPAIVLAALIAFVVSPIVRLFERWLKGKHGLAVALTYLLVIVALILIPVILIPAVINAVNDLISVDYQAIVEQGASTVKQLSAQVKAVPIAGGIVGPILDSIVQTLDAATSAAPPEGVSVSVTLAEASGRLASTLGSLVQVLGPVVSAIASLVFMILIALYISMTGHQMQGWLRPLIPPGYEPEITGLFQKIGGIWSAFLRSQLTLMVFIGTVVWLGNLILGNSNAVLLGVISGSLELIPNIGPAIALIPGVLMALLFGSSHFAVSPVLFALIVLAFYLLVQLFENQVVVPKIMGEAVDLPPLVVILGVFVGGATVGILGVLLATPVIATGREVFLYFYNKILEPPPSPPEEEKPSILDSIRGLAARIKLPGRLRLPRLRREKHAVAPAAAATVGAPVAAAGPVGKQSPALAASQEGAEAWGEDGSVSRPAAADVLPLTA